MDKQPTKPKKTVVKKTIYLSKKKEDVNMKQPPKRLKVPWDIVGLGLIVIALVSLFVWLGCF